MSEQAIVNPYDKIRELEQFKDKVITWARVDIRNRNSETRRTLPPCLVAEDVVRLTEGVM